MKPKVISVQVKSKEMGRPGLPKIAQESITVTKEGAIGDYNHFRKTKKGNTLDRAILIFPQETIDELRKEGWNVRAGDLGENITTVGILQETMEVEMRLKIGEVEVELTEQCKPCHNLAVLPYVQEKKVSNFIQTLKGRRGWYAKVLTEGSICRGDTIEILS